MAKMDFWKKHGPIHAFEKKTIRNIWFFLIDKFSYQSKAKRNVMEGLKGPTLLILLT